MQYGVVMTKEFLQFRADPEDKRLFAEAARRSRFSTLTGWALDALRSAANRELPETPKEEKRCDTV